MTIWIDNRGEVVEDHQVYVAEDGTTYPAQYPKGEIDGLASVTETARPDDRPETYTVDGQARGGDHVIRGDDGREWEVVDGLQVWRTMPRPMMTADEAAAVAARDLVIAADTALRASDLTLLRCVEAGVALPQAWRDYRAALRALKSGGPGPLPARPAYPEGT